MNAYIYAVNDPVNRIDPSGMCSYVPVTWNRLDCLKTTCSSSRSYLQKPVTSNYSPGLPSYGGLTAKPAVTNYSVGLPSYGGQTSVIRNDYLKKQAQDLLARANQIYCSTTAPKIGSGAGTPVAGQLSLTPGKTTTAREEFLASAKKFIFGTNKVIVSLKRGLFGKQ
jgi:hypothetical protein